MKKTLANWAVVFIYGTVVFYLSTRPLEFYPPIEIRFFDLFVHAVIYGLLALFLARALVLGARTKRLVFCTIAVAAASIYGALMEWCQAYVPTRTPSLSDVIANLVGACLGVGLYVLHYKLRKSRNVVKKLKIKN